MSGAAGTGVDSCELAGEGRTTLYIPKRGSAEEVQSGAVDQGNMLVTGRKLSYKPATGCGVASLFGALHYSPTKKS